ncbi:hypothetical protein HDU87_008033 [Geranomyces variabilis]|uniref:NYN domain-containing protein n=1 Tax=Geranomyces variabilis TaxID=109894 RepID=A0AAD5TP54_9FUNG|nr:hypothetical protein HDU87_008033 [Geranomyces variabilis]
MFRFHTPGRARSAAPASFQATSIDRHPPVKAADAPPPKVAVFWEFQDGCLTGHAPTTVVNAIRNAVRPLGQLVQFRAYVAGPANLVPVAEETMKAQSELSLSGVSLISCPLRGRKKTADAMIVSDVFTFALDNPAPAAVVLISNDGDFSYALSLLNGRGYTIGLICSEETPSSVLQSSATAVISWADIVPTMEYHVTDQPAERRHVAPPAPNAATYVRRAPSFPPGPSVQKFAPAPFKPRPIIPSKVAPTPPRPSSPANLGSLHPENNGATNGAGVYGLHFGQLINILTSLKEAGNVEPLWSQVGSKIDKEFLRRRGITFKEYINAAVEKGLVICGSGRGAGSEWMALPPTRHVKPPPVAEEPAASDLEDTHAVVTDHADESDDSENESMMEFTEFAGPTDAEEPVVSTETVAPDEGVVDAL